MVPVDHFTPPGGRAGCFAGGRFPPPPAARSGVTLRLIHPWAATVSEKGAGWNTDMIWRSISSRESNRLSS